MSNLQELSDKELLQLISNKEDYMSVQEMADDFYYTNGRRNADLQELNAYKEELRRRGSVLDN